MLTVENRRSRLPFLADVQRNVLARLRQFFCRSIMHHCRVSVSLRGNRSTASRPLCCADSVEEHLCDAGLPAMMAFHNWRILEL